MSIAIAISVAIVASGNLRKAGTSVLAPGTVQDLGGAVRVELASNHGAGDSPSQDVGAVSPGRHDLPGSSGGVRMLTVRTWGATYADLVYAALRSDVVVVEDPERDLPSDHRETRRAAQLISSELVAQAVALRKASVPFRLSGSGARVEEISTEAARESLAVGDVITEVAGVPIRVVDDIKAALEGRSPGETVSVELLREGRPARVEVRLSSGTDQDRPVLLGVLVTTVGMHVESPYRIDFALDGVGGSSAGLAFALEIYMRVTGRDLTGGKSVAATGELAADGSVQAVGGVAQKARAASSAGVQLLLVPRQNRDEAMASAPDVETVGVSTFDEAVSVLEALAGEER